MNTRLPSNPLLKAVFLALSSALGLSVAGNEENFQKYAMFLNSSERAKPAAPVKTTLPLALPNDTRIALVGNTLFDRMRDFGHFEAILQKAHPKLNLVLRNLAWSADEVDLQPRPSNFADDDQHLTAMKADLILAAFGFNESFAGKDGLKDFAVRLSAYLKELKSKALQGLIEQIVFLSH